MNFHWNKGAVRGTLHLVRTLRTRIEEHAWIPLVSRAVVAAFSLAALSWIGRYSQVHRQASEFTTETRGQLGFAFVTATGEDAASTKASAPVSSSANVASREAGAANALGHESATSSTRAANIVVLNRASAEDLRTLPGVGAKRAEAIIQLREKLGGFRHLEDLLRVKGVGRKALARWRGRIVLDEEAPDGGRPN